MARQSLMQERLVAMSDSFIAAVTRKEVELAEQIAVYHVDRDTLYSVSDFPIKTNSAASLHFVHGNSILVVDSPLYTSAFVYSLQGQLNCTVDLPVNRLGVKQFAVFPDLSLLLCGCFDSSLRFFALDDGPLAPILKTAGAERFVTSESVTVFRESLEVLPPGHIRQQLHVLGAELEDVQVTYEKVELGFGAEIAIPSTKSIVDYQVGGNPKVGIAQVEVTMNKYVAVRADDAASSVRVYDATDFRLVAVLLHRAPVRHIAWSPASMGAKLAVVTGEPRVFVTDIATNETVGIFNVPFAATRLYWGEQSLLVESHDRVASLRQVTTHKGG